jgi:hypothetical protein
MSASPEIRIAAILLWITSFGFGIFCFPAIWSLIAGRGVPIVFGFPAYGKGPFERIGIPTTAPLVAGFLLVSLVDGVAGWLLWGGHRSGAILLFATLPFGAVYWWGFALPIPPVLIAASTVLAAIAWGRLS